MEICEPGKNFDLNNFMNDLGVFVRRAKYIQMMPDSSHSEIVHLAWPVGYMFPSAFP